MARSRNKKLTPLKPRNIHAYLLVLRASSGAAGKHHTRDHDVVKGRSRKPKHKGRQEW